MSLHLGPFDSHLKEIFMLNVYDQFGDLVLPISAEHLWGTVELLVFTSLDEAEKVEKYLRNRGMPDNWKCKVFKYEAKI